MDQTEYDASAVSLRSDPFVNSIQSAPTHEPDSLFERCAWFYALCREYLFRDHTQEIAHALFPNDAPDPGTRLIEVGCGPGFYACRLSEELPNLTTVGIDLSESLIQRAASRARDLKLPNCSFRHADAHALPFASDSIDAVVVSRLFLIVPEKEGVIREIFRVLKPEGRCFIAEPTSGFRTRLPLALMWIVSRFTFSPAKNYREPQQAEVLSRQDFAELVRTQLWGLCELHYDGFYQYAVCQKAVSGVQPR
jgi:ubiquinone/menaquinone biosynthesis C-methylase UbiE